jgi:2-polyprenyl-6-methoxyphenol hydroxylase-like FAD-dependent oxidoreductase
MRQVDVVVIGGGLAGSVAAAMLGRRGIDTVLIDPHESYPPDFRCEKLDRTQVALLRKTGLHDDARRAVTVSDGLWVAHGRGHAEKLSSGQYYFMYDTLVNAIRAAIPPGVRFVPGKVSSVLTSPGRQSITLSTGETFAARLAVVAMGLNVSLLHSLGITRRVESACHSISIGFDLMPLDRPRFGFPALTYFPEKFSERIAYLSLFPIGNTTRANLFVYRAMQDLWLRDMRYGARETLLAAMPGLARHLGNFDVTSAVKIRPVDLYVSEGHRQHGMVLVGDAFATSCPAAGTGANKALCDVERLCNVHIPRWLATNGMELGKIAQFYDDPVKQASDAASAEKAGYVKAIATERGLRWSTRRWTKTVGHRLGLGAIRDLPHRVAAGMRRQSPA